VATPTWKLDEQLTFDVRTRLDLGWREGDVDEDLVFRVRPRLTLGLRGGGERPRRLFFGDEVNDAFTTGASQSELQLTLVHSKAVSEFRSGGAGAARAANAADRGQ
jgi:hypothetical protein